MYDDYLTWKPFFAIVPMQIEDCPEVAELHGLRFARRWGGGEFQNLLLQPSAFGFVARQTNAFFSQPLGGFVLAREAAGEAEILTLAIDEKSARLGLGWRLMQAALREALNRGGESMFLEVADDNRAAVKLYRKLGFATVGSRPAYYAGADGTRSSALVMKRDLG